MERPHAGSDLGGLADPARDTAGVGSERAVEVAQARDELRRQPVALALALAAGPDLEARVRRTTARHLELDAAAHVVAHELPAWRPGDRDRERSDRQVVDGS